MKKKQYFSLQQSVSSAGLFVSFLMLHFTLIAHKASCGTVLCVCQLAQVNDNVSENVSGIERHTDCPFVRFNSCPKCLDFLS